MPRDAPDPLPIGLAGDARSYRAREPLHFVSPCSLHGAPVPERQWIVKDWLGVGHTTGLYGDGGTGKTLLAQQLMTSCATGVPWLGLAVQRCRAMGIFCEDDANELHRRQVAINQTIGLSFDRLFDMTWASAIGQDNALVAFDSDNRARETPRMLEFKQAAKAFEARLLVIDTAADTFCDNENDRAKVRGFVSTLNRVAQDLQAAVLLNLHPSRSGLRQDGDFDGGSTAWSNTLRSRWSLSRPKSDCQDDADTDKRILTRRKANYASVGDTLKLRWQRGVLVSESGFSGFSAISAEVEADQVFMTLLATTAAEGRHVSENAKAGNYAPKEFAKRRERCGLGSKEFDGAMERLFAAGKIRVEEYGRNSGRGRPRHIVAAW